MKKHAEKCQNEPCTCDGYHTFDELYEHRFNLYIALCKALPEPHYIWKSKLHNDGSRYDGWFIMGIGKEKGTQISYHLPLSRWDECDFADTIDFAPEWDGYTSDDVLDRLKNL